MTTAGVAVLHVPPSRSRRDPQAVVEEFPRRRRARGPARSCGPRRLRRV